MDMEKESIRKILIIKISAVGDIIRSLPALVSVARIFPRATIDFMISEKNAELIEHCPYIKEIIKFDVDKYSKDHIAFLKFAMGIRKRKYDLVLNLQNTGRYDLLGKISGARHRSEIITHERPINGVDGVFRILETVGISTKRRYFEFWFSEGDHDFAAKFMGENGIKANDKLIGLCPGGGWQSKQWPIAYYSELAGKLAAAADAKIIVFGSAGELDRAEYIKKNSAAQVIIASGKTTLRQAGRLIAECSLFVSNDSGLMHLAAHLEVPTVGIFGSTHPGYHGPYGERSMTVYRGVECSPCYNPECKLDFDRYFCLNTTAVEEVFRISKKVIR